MITLQNGPRRIRLFHHFEEMIAGFALVVLVVTVCWGVVTRYVTATSAAWTGDISSIAFAWLIFMGSAAAFKYGMHMSIDIFWMLLPKPVRRWLGAAIDLLIIGFLAYATWLGVSFCLASMDAPLPITRWPRSVLYAAVMVGFACMLLRYSGIAWRKFHGNTAPTHDLAGTEKGDTKWV